MSESNGASGVPFCHLPNIFGRDWAVLALVLEYLVNRISGGHILRICELGVKEGYTSKAIMDWFQRHWMPYMLDGVDNQRQICPVWAGEAYSAYFYRMTTTSAASMLARAQYDLVIFDACHCANCVISDWTHWKDKIALGGIAMFHDANVSAQGVGKGIFFGHLASEGIQVREGLKACDFDGFALVHSAKAVPSGVELGGWEIYQRGS